MRGHSDLPYSTMAKACVITLLLLGCSSEPQGPEGPEGPGPNGPTPVLRVEARPDTTLTGTVGITILPVPVVRVTLDGNPAPGREVRFIVSGGGSIGIASERTDTAGIASPGRWTLGTRVQPQTLTARVDGAADVVFTAVAKAGPPATMDIVAGNHQTAAANAPLPLPLQVKVADQYGNPAAGASVSYSVAVGTGTVLGAIATADAFGVASSGVWTLGGTGVQVVRSSVPGRNVYFEAFACEDPCRGRDLLFAEGNRLYSLVDGVATPLFTAASGSGVSSPAWSADGRRVAFAVGDYDSDGEVSHLALYLMNADGSNPVVRAEGFWNPSWSPDGRRLAVAGPAGVYNLSAEEDGTAPILLAAGSDPAWSPDGTKIAFEAWESEGTSLKVMNADGSAVTTLVPGDGFSTYDPTWSPGGSSLAFTQCSTSCTIHSVSASGTDLRQLTTFTAWQPAWSPDGSRIAFVTASGIAWLPAAGGFSEPLLMYPGGNSPAWRP